MRPFLRGARVALFPTTAEAPVGPGAWVDPGPQGPARDEVLLALRRGSEEVGVVGLTSLDWHVRSARLCAGGQAVAPEDWTEAVALVTRYAFEELNLERVEAFPSGAAAGALLAATGLYGREGGSFVARRAGTPGPR